jgi:hypothetical protein
VTETGVAPPVVERQGSDASRPPDGTSGFPVVVWVVAAVLAALYPGLLYQSLAINYAFRFQLYVSMTAIVVAFTVAVFAALYYAAFRRDFRRSAGVAAVITLTLFSWLRIADLGEWISDLSHIGLFTDAVPVLLVAAVWWVALRYANRDHFVVILFAILAAAFIVSGINSPPRVDAGSESPPTVASAGPAPSVVVLILDGYARADVLRSLYDFDNSAFLEALAERGFRIRDDALTNYSVTHASLPSMVDMGYPFEVGVPLATQAKPMRRLLSGDGAMMHLFDGAGYETVMFENAWSGSICGRTPDRCHRTGLFDRSVWGLGQMSPLAAIQTAIVTNPFSAVSLQHIRELGDAIKEDATAPLFILAHATIPHPPIQLNATCGTAIGSARTAYLLSPVGSVEADWREARTRYVDQLQCVNAEVIASVDRLIAADEDVEIVIISDHGPDSQGQFLAEDGWSDAQLIERMAVLSAVRMSDRCDEPGPALTTVNTLRRAAACALGTDLVELPDRSFTAPPIGNITEPVLEVTDRLALISGVPADSGA